MAYTLKLWFINIKFIRYHTRIMEFIRNVILGKK